MRKNLMIACWSLLALAGYPVLAQETYNDNATDKVAGREGVAGEKGAAPLGPQSRVGMPANTATANAGVTGGNAANQWRYRHHNGHWWYYHPNNQWSYWNGNAWSGYNPQTYRQWYSSRPAYGGNFGYSSGYRGNYYGNGMYGGGYGNGMYGRNYYGNGYGNGMYGGNYGNGYGSPSANFGGAVGGVIGGARGANAGAAIGGAVGGFGRR
ncbi:MAG TPA: hypothetical protein VNH11_12745 [Pirellulales bacterium]|nr:hypothetical protein [Pirellulales bacterium]